MALQKDLPAPHRSHARVGPLQGGRAWYGSLAPGRAEAMGEENHADHLAAIHDPATVRAMLEDYRAGLGVDRAADEADRAAGRRVTCPTLVLWSNRDDLVELVGDPLAIWAAGPTTCAGEGRSTAGTTWPRRRLASWRPRSSRSSRCDLGVPAG